MTEWSQYTLGELADIYDGPHATPTKTDSGPWFLSISSLDRGRLNLAESAHVSYEDFERWTRRVTPEHGDVLFSYETRLGEAALMPSSVEACLGRRMGLLRVRPGMTDSRFLLYAYLGPDFQATIQRNKVPGATVERIPLVEMGKWPIKVPPLSVQRAIAAVLAALDEKIAANERIAKTAVALADTSFEQIARGLGFGPETFGSTASVNGGGTPSTKAEDYWGGPIAWTTPSDVTALASPYLFATSRTITNVGLANCASPLYPISSIFMTSRATIGAFALPQIPAAVNQGFIVVTHPNEDMRWWLFHEMRARVDEMHSLANGSTFLELSRKNFKAMLIRLPADETLQQFSSTVGPLHRRAAQASSENSTLNDLRDTLLPKLMSGQLRVKDAERIVEDAT